MLPDTTKVFEIRVAPQKNSGGFLSVYIKATIQGKEPRGKSCPRTISPDLPVGTPQVATLLRNRLIVNGEAAATIAKPVIKIKIFLCVISIFNVRSEILMRITNNDFS